jgi:hypothetical protein
MFSFRLIKRARGVLLLVVLASACSTTAGQPATNVTFVIPIPVESFSPTAVLQVSLWNAPQLEVLNRQANCAVSYDAQTKTESVHCPEGVQYQKVTPEEFSFPVQAITHNIHLTSQAVKIGEKYRIALRGLSRDDCNSASAQVEGTATASAITLGDLDWMTTLMACVATP